MFLASFHYFYCFIDCARFTGWCHRACWWPFFVPVSCPADSGASWTEYLLSCFCSPSGGQQIADVDTLTIACLRKDVNIQVGIYFRIYRIMLQLSRRWLIIIEKQMEMEQWKERNHHWMLRRFLMTSRTVALLFLSFQYGVALEWLALENSDSMRVTHRYTLEI